MSKSALQDGDGRVSNTSAALAGAFAGMTEAFINCPFETVKVRMQSPAFSNFNGTMEVLSALVKQEGASAVFKGLDAMMLRNAA